MQFLPRLQPVFNNNRNAETLQQNTKADATSSQHQPQSNGDKKKSKSVQADEKHHRHSKCNRS